MILGIDLGGTKIAFAAFTRGEAASLTKCWPNIQPSLRIPTPADYPTTLAALARQVATFSQELGAFSAIGIGLPGALTPTTGRIKNANSEWLIGRDLVADLGKRVGLPVFASNDANAFALAEAQGQAQEALFGVILGTGVGGGVVIHGRVVEGLNGVAGEWGHLSLANDGLVAGLPENPLRPCYCGNRGCIETLLSGPAFSADLLLALEATPALLREAIEAARPGLSESHKSMLCQEGVATLATAPNLGLALRRLFPPRPVADQDLAAFPIEELLRPEAQYSEGLMAAIAAAKERYFARATAALKGVVQIIDPEIVLGGGMSRMPGLVEALQTRLPKAIFNAARGGDAELPKVKVRLSRHGDDAGVRGAAQIAAANLSSS